MHYVGLVLAFIALGLGILDLLFWHYADRYRNHRFLQWAMILLSLAVILGVHGMLPVS